MDLVAPDPALFPSFRASMREWDGAHQDGAGIRDMASLLERDGFETWVAQLLAEEAEPAGPGFVTCTYRWLVEDGEYLGSVALRHELNDFLARFGGHVGYGVRPSARGRGLATQALRGILPFARRRGVDEVLVICDEQNPASRAVIERCGGRFEDAVQDDDGRTLRRYWIGTTPSA
ncbi:GNAT family N-acetyltransferase [Brachybacterium horti]